MVNISKKGDARPEERGLASLSGSSLFERFFDDSLFDPFTMPSLLGARRLGAFRTVFPKVDVSETDAEIKVVANIPGVDPDRIDIEVGDDYLSLSGAVEKETREDSDEKGIVYRYEREYGEFRREFTLPSRVDKDKIVAKAKNGVLTLTLPKIAEDRRKTIKVEKE